MNVYANRVIPVMLCLLLVAALAHGDTYHMRYLDTPDGSTSEPRAINDYGVIAGGIYSPTAATAALWSRSGALSTPVPGDAWAYDVNDAGEILGEFRGPDSYSHPYIYSPGIGTTDLFSVLPVSAHVWRISVGRQVVGDDDASWPSGRVFSWDEKAGTTYLPTSSYLNAHAVGISDLGIVAGTVELQDHTARAFAWSAQMGLTIMFPDGPANSALAVSSGGTILGSTSLGEGIEEPFVWSAELGKITMGTRTWDNQFSPSAVNDRGYVAGTVTAPGTPEKAFVWNPQTGAFTILGEGRAYDIDNDGWVVGRVGNDDNALAVVWEPVPAPEPSSLVALGMGLLPLAGMLARRRRGA